MVEDRQRFIRTLQIWVQEKFFNSALVAERLPNQVPAYIAEPPLDLPKEESRPLVSIPETQPILEAQPHVQVQELPPAAIDQELARIQDLVLDTFNTVLYPARMEMDDNFFDFGGNSFLAIKVRQVLSEKLQLHLPITHLYTHLDPRNLALQLWQDSQNQGLNPASTEPQSPALPKASEANAIAIIGMACKVPGAQNLHEFWDMVQEGREGITHFSSNELDPSLPDKLIKHPHYVRARGVIDGDRFDHEFFEMNRREASFLDPQQRVLMETCWQALEDAGWAHRRQSVRIGVYAGVGSITYQTRNVMMGHAAPHSEEEFLAAMGNDKDYVATHIAYQLDLRGPAVSVHTACSTSLVAVVEAIKTLLTDEADIVVAGAASVNAPMASGHLYQEGGIFSRDGHCRPFASASTGTLFSDGSAVVVLKRLDRAIADGDSIHAVIHGWSVNNDGRKKTSFAAPSIEGQSQVIRKAYERAGWSPRTVSYMECHGTATPIGDPMEIEGLRVAFQTFTSDKQFCALGSVKANIGHLTAAAGTIGLIKAALVVNKGIIPPALHAYPLNAELRLQQSPFHVPQSRQVWSNPQYRRAGVSSFGVGGTNSHVLIEAAPHRQTAAPSRDLDPWTTLSWSAKDPSSCQRYIPELIEVLPRAPLHELSYTMGRHRSRFSYRQSVTGSHAEELQQLMQKLYKAPQFYPDKTPPIIMMFPGQGSQYPKMGQDLARAWPRFAGHYQKTIKAFTQRFDLDLQAALDGVEANGVPLLQSTLYTQPALFCLEWALARSLIDCGLPIVALMGHSIGEVTAAAIAEVFSLDDAVHLVYHRALHMQAAPQGSMLALRATQERINSLLPRDISLCVINSNESCVIGGEQKSIEALMPLLKSKGIAFKQLETSHAFHSPMMDGIMEDFRSSIQNIKFHAPRYPVISALDAKPLLADRIATVDYWVQQIRQAVNFADAIEYAASQHHGLFLEVGPRDALSRFVQQVLREEGRWPSQALLTKSSVIGGEEAAFLQAVSELANYGIPLFVAEQGTLVSAPAYPFLGEKHWLEPRNPESIDSSRLDRSKSAAVSSGDIELPMRAPQGATGWLKNLTDSLVLLTGIEAHKLSEEAAWQSLGLDSLLLTQWSLKLQKEWGIKMSLNMLQNELPHLGALAQHMQKILPMAPSETQPLPSSHSSKTSAVLGASALDIPDLDAATLGEVLQQQVQLMQKQIELLNGIFGRQPKTQGAAAETKSPAKVESPEPVAEKPVKLTAENPPVRLRLQKDEPQLANPVSARPDPLPGFLSQLVHEGEIEFATDQGVIRLPRYRGSFLALGADGQTGLFIENPEQTGEFWQVVGE